MKARLPDPEKITPSTPLRLAIAVGIAFPDGSLTAAGLRKEIARGNLEIERIAGKQYTTLHALQIMRERCRVPPSPPASGSAPRGISKPGSSSTEDSR